LIQYNQGRGIAVVLYVVNLAARHYGLVIPTDVLEALAGLILAAGLYFAADAKEVLHKVVHTDTVTVTSTVTADPAGTTPPENFKVGRQANDNQNSRRGCHKPAYLLTNPFCDSSVHGGL